MDKTKLFSCTDRSEWRAWLSEHFETESEVWFVFPNLSANEPGVCYNDAVEEALCFGWIDGRAGTLDEAHHIRRFTPRRKGSPFSQPNIERLKLLNPIYYETASYGHFGRDPKIVTKQFADNKIKVELFTWEKLDYVDKIKKAFKH